MTATALNILHNEKDAEFRTCFYILKHSPTSLWEQPILTFIDNVKEKLPNGELGLSDKKIRYCNYFMRGLARYIYAKKLGENTLKENPIENEMQNATALAKQSKMYKVRIEVTPPFEQKLNGDIPKELQWGLCAVVEFARTDYNEFTKRETKLKSDKPVLETAVVEQFLSDQWKADFPNETNEWTTERIQKSLQTIGNLVLVEQGIHKNTSKICDDNFFAKRKNPDTGKGYNDSIFGEMIMLCDTPDIMEWTYLLYRVRQDYCKQRLIEFFTASDDIPL
jgi:hypothetical protein